MKTLIFGAVVFLAGFIPVRAQALPVNNDRVDCGGSASDKAHSKYGQEICNQLKIKLNRIAAESKESPAARQPLPADWKVEILFEDYPTVSGIKTQIHIRAGSNANLSLHPNVASGFPVDWSQPAEDVASKIVERIYAYPFPKPQPQSQI